MKRNLVMLGVVAVMATTALLGTASVSFAQNLLTNGDLETWSNGIPNSWRWYAVAGADASITQTTAPGTYTSGSSGALLTWNSSPGDSSLDTWDNKNIVLPNHVYKLLVDARYGSGANAFNTTLQVCDSAGNFLRQVRETEGAYMNNNFQTFASEVTMAADNTERQLSTRLDSLIGASNYVDNVRLLDVTNSGNRMLNGDFENSSTQLLNWRSFAVGGSASSVSISHDAKTGSNAALFSVTAVGGDAGLDDWFDPVGAIGGETLSVSFSAKNVGEAGKSIMYQLLQFNAAGTPFAPMNFTATPGANGYSTFSQTYTMDPTAVSAYIGFRIVDGNGAFSTGSFLIDNVYMGAVPEPGSLVGLSFGLMSLAGFLLKRKA